MNRRLRPADRRTKPQGPSDTNENIWRSRIKLAEQCTVITYNNYVRNDTSVRLNLVRY